MAALCRATPLLILVGCIGTGTKSDTGSYRDERETQEALCSMFDYAYVGVNTEELTSGTECTAAAGAITLGLDCGGVDDGATPTTVRCGIIAVGLVSTSDYGDTDMGELWHRSAFPYYGQRAELSFDSAYTDAVSVNHADSSYLDATWDGTNLVDVRLWNNPTDGTSCAFNWSAQTFQLMRTASTGLVDNLWSDSDLHDCALKE